VKKLWGCIHSVFLLLLCYPFLLTWVCQHTLFEKLPGIRKQLFVKCLKLRFYSIAVSTFIGVALIFLFIEKFSQETILIILLLGSYHLFYSIADIFLAKFKGYDRMGLVALLSILLKFIILCPAILLILLKFDFMKVLICFPVGSFLFLIVCIYLSLDFFKGTKTEGQKLSIKEIFIEILPFTFALLFASALYHQDILILKFFHNDQIVGIFSAANVIVLAFIGILAFVHTAFLPTFSKLFLESRAKLIEVSRQSLRYLLLLSLPIATGLYAISSKLIVFLYSDTFIKSVDVLNILCWTIVFGFGAITFSALLIAINRQKEMVIVIGICLAFNLVANLLLVPDYSYNGAAIAKLMTEALHLILMSYLGFKYLASLFVREMVLKQILSCLLMLVVVKFLYEWNLLILILAGSIVYILSLAALKAYSKEEIELVKKFCKKILYHFKFIKIYDPGD